MYYIINKTTNKTIKYEGSFPSDFVEKMLNNQEDLIIISTYSNTVKVPYELEAHGSIYWEWEDYPIKDYLEHYQETEGV